MMVFTRCSRMQITFKYGNNISRTKYNKLCNSLITVAWSFVSSKNTIFKNFIIFILNYYFERHWLKDFKERITVCGDGKTCDVIVRKRMSGMRNLLNVRCRRKRQTSDRHDNVIPFIIVAVTKSDWFDAKCCRKVTNSYWMCTRGYCNSHLYVKNEKASVKTVLVSRKVWRFSSLQRVTWLLSPGGTFTIVI